MSAEMIDLDVIGATAKLAEMSRAGYVCELHVNPLQASLARLLVSSEKVVESDDVEAGTLKLVVQRER